MKKFYESLREHVKIIIDFEKKKNVTVNKRRAKTSLSWNVYYIWGKRILEMLSKIIN